ncbi:MAG: thiosulfate oxidation carrier protein SoxY [Gammaproteobacteria bacterium]
MVLLRRTFLSHSVLNCFAWLAGLFSSRRLRGGEPEPAFAEQSVEQLLTRLAGDLEIQGSDRIELNIPDVAEDGAIVPITVASSLDEVHWVAVIGEKNPIPLIARFHFAAGAECFVQARIKLAESARVIVLVNADNQMYSMEKFVRVTVGGCGT